MRFPCRAAIVLAVLAGSLLPPAPPGAGADPLAGALDASFGDGGKVVVKPPAEAGEWPAAQAVASDGKIVVVGTAAPARNGYAFLLLRFMPDGRLDPSFGTAGRVWTDLVTLATPLRGAVEGDVALGASTATAVAIQPDGKILVGGATQSGGTTAWALMRYLADGRPDTTFGSDGLTVTDFDPSTNDSMTSLLLRPDGRIVAAGAAGDNAALARYLPDGQLDPTFGGSHNGTVTTGGGMLNALALEVARDGKLLIAGQAGEPGGPFDFGAARYSADGVPDASFGQAGAVRTDLGSTGEWAAGVAPGPDGTVVVGGASGSSFTVLRYRADGQLDPAFGTGGISKAGPDIGGAHAMVELPDGRPILVGEQVAGDFRQVAVARYRADGALDPGFGT
ncbi:MAG TPA: delta-60 repeat domain-containing protein, partial [Acidimicrobiia bacterium]|nr:delta-60 repeat domain-containing protein [Acidimicrobiia bacterium]